MAGILSPGTVLFILVFRHFVIQCSVVSAPFLTRPNNCYVIMPFGWSHICIKSTCGANVTLRDIHIRDGLRVSRI